MLFVFRISKNLTTCAQDHSVYRVACNAVGFEHVLAALTRIRDVGGGNFVRSQIEVVSDHDLIDFTPYERADLHQVGINFMAFGKDECAAMGGPFGQCEGGGGATYILRSRTRMSP